MGRDLKTYTFGFGHGDQTPYDYGWALEAQQEHWDKYDALAKKHGFAYGGSPVPVAQVQRYLADGDWSLNTMPVHRWAAHSAWLVGKPNLQGHAMSHAEAVCTIKHAAKVAAGCVRPARDDERLAYAGLAEK